MGLESYHTVLIIVPLVCRVIDLTGKFTRSNYLSSATNKTSFYFSVAAKKLD